MNTETMVPKTACLRYVSVIAIDPSADELLLVRKTKGPAHLIGKQTFPGGKVEISDTSVAGAASREVLEESGLKVRAQDLIHLTRKGNQHFSLDVFVAILDLKNAGHQTHEEEPVYRASWSKTKQDVLDNPHDYVNDTGYLLDSVDGVSILRRLLMAPKRSTRSTSSPSLSM